MAEGALGSGWLSPALHWSCPGSWALYSHSGPHSTQAVIPAMPLGRVQKLGPDQKATQDLEQSHLSGRRKWVRSA